MATISELCVQAEAKVAGLRSSVATLTEDKTQLVVVNNAQAADINRARQTLEMIIGNE